MISVKRLGMDRAQGRAGMPCSTWRVMDGAGEDAPRAPCAGGLGSRHRHRRDMGLHPVLIPGRRNPGEQDMTRE